MKNPCSGCDLCCRKYTIFTFPENAKEIAFFLRISVKDFLNKYANYYIELYDLENNAKLSPVDDKKIAEKYGKSCFMAFSLKSDSKCVFLENSECKIYDVRPLICRLFPNYKFYGEEFPFCKIDKKQEAKDPREFFYILDNYTKSLKSKGFKGVWGGDLPAVSKENICVMKGNKKLVADGALVKFIKKKVG
ncbi:MAG: YkgJ family cysteine cluster protein [Candidatus ainarchaeum sp.]|nr:YkgJ family cysteine cluster protein [Candidatus ainarchaeum sp.]